MEGARISTFLQKEVCRKGLISRVLAHSGKEMEGLLVEGTTGCRSYSST